ncbi:alpha-ketoglutarate-dependent dioxygenase AlkB [Geminocystis sp. NIES-3709]|uniref:alpha-ketoglutarate-dependent dioxygenase AlkB family protein n=1 Tax=Geminocystis sp. NIES-3709 TaxID=1617448 RepID=UPI0005FC3ECD|nr:alpha-ketoglutarate-dependent dioxygenase AlkB [Geminocystis sp. NIES-3709]BAQ66506.1 alkylated DNA repair protein AlkB [Geminocystis sp. NIES-3709]
MLKLDLPNSDIVYYPNLWSLKEANVLLQKLENNIQWQQDYITLFGKTHLQPRLTAWYGDRGKIYSYSGITMYPHDWIRPLLTIKETIEPIAKVNFNSVLLNFYRNGQDSMGWHSDNEKELGKKPIIASVSFGGERQFLLKPRDKNVTTRGEILLNHGSLLIMAGNTQKYWLHQIPKTTKFVSSRINLTFRVIVTP